MIETKCFEIRDRHTYIGAIAQSFDPDALLDDGERSIIRRSGYRGRRYVLLTKLVGDIETQYDSHSWGGSARTMPEAHRHIEQHWSELASGDVIDVEFILGESTAKKTSERLEAEYVGA